MRWFKIILIAIGVPAAVCLTLLAVALATLDQDDYRRLATRALTHFTGYTVTVEGPFSLHFSSEPSLTAQAIRFEAGPTGDPPPITGIGTLKIRIALWPLLTGTLVVRELRVEGVDLTIETAAAAETDDRRDSHSKTLLEVRIPVFESVRLENIQFDLVDRAANRRNEVRLRRLSIDDRRDGGPLLIEGDGSISGNDFTIEGRLGAVASILEGKAPYPLALEVRAAGFHLAVSGTVEDVVAGEGLALQLSGETGELSLLLGMLNIQTPPLGDLKFQATVSGDVIAPRVSELALILSRDARCEVAVNGAVENVVRGEGPDLGFTAACADPEVLAWLLPANLPEIHHIRVEGAVRETEGALAAENLAIRIDAAQGLSANAGGRIGLGQGLGALSLTEMDIDIEMSMPRPHILQAYGVDWPAELGPLTVRTRLTGLLDGLALEDFFLQSGGAGPARITARGRIGRLPIWPTADRRPSQIDLRVALQADTTRVLTSPLGLNFPELRAFELHTRIQGSLDRFQLTEIDGRAAAPQGLQVGVTGRIDFQPGPASEPLGNLDIRARITAPSVAAALAPFGRTGLPDLKPLRADARIGGSFEALSLDQVTFSAGQSGPLRLEISGDIGRLPLDGRPVSGVKLAAVLAADSTAVLSTVAGGSIPDFGPLKITARIGERDGTIGASGLHIVIGEENAAALTATGRIATLLRPSGVSIDGIDLTAVVRNFVLQPLAGRLGRSLAELGSLSGRFQVTGDSKSLAISDADLTTLSPLGLKVAATGGIARIRLGGEKPVEGLHLSLTATAPGWAALPAAAGLGLPDLGPLQVKATINDRSGSFDVEAFEIRGGTAQQDLLRLQGQILHIGIPQRMALNAVFETASRPWVSHYRQKSVAVDVPLAGAIRATAHADGFRIDEIRLAAADERLTIGVQGRVRQWNEPAALELQLEARAPEPAALASMAGIALPAFGPLAIDGRIGGNAQKLIFSGEARFGDTLFQSSISAEFTSQRPIVVAGFASDIVQLKDLGITPAPPPEEIPTLAENSPPPAAMVFDDTPLPLDLLKSFDLVFTLDAETIIGQGIRIENLDLDITLGNGRLRIFPASMVYAAGFTDIHFTLDASGPIPAFDLKITGEDVDIDDLLASAHEPIILSGELNLAVDLHSVGRSRRELASNLTGDFSLAIENGRIRRIVNFLSTDALNLVFTTVDRRRHTDLNCLVGRIFFQDGVGDIDVLFMDTPNIRARAAGNLDLAAEKLDIVIHPIQKRRFLRRQTSAVRIRGPLSAPSFSTMPLEEAARLFATMLAPYVFLPERMLGELWHLIRRDRNASPCTREMRFP